MDNLQPHPTIWMNLTNSVEQKKPDPGARTAGFHLYKVQTQAELQLRVLEVRMVVMLLQGERPEGGARRFWGCYFPSGP